MARYFSARPKACFELEDLDCYGERFESVYLGTPNVPEHVSSDTGLLDKDGNAIMRAPNPVGFIWDY